MRFEQSTSVHYQAISHMKWNDNGFIMNLRTLFETCRQLFFKKSWTRRKKLFSLSALRNLLSQKANCPKLDQLRKKDAVALFKNKSFFVTKEINLLETKFLVISLNLLNGKYSPHKKSIILLTRNHSIKY